MNHFPLFALVLRAKDPWRLPGGLYFDFVPARVKVKMESYVDGGSRDVHPRNVGDNDVPSASAPTPDLGNPSDLKVERSEPLASKLVPILEVSISVLVFYVHAQMYILGNMKVLWLRSFESKF